MMELEDEIMLEDDNDILGIIDFGFPRRIFRRPNYFEEMDDMAFYRRFRLTKPTTLYVLELVEDALEFENDLNNSVTPINQLLTALSFYASDGHQINIGDFMKMDQSTVSRVIKKVSEAIASKRNIFIKMPATHQEKISSQTNFHRVAGFPRVIGCVDGTHVKIQSPGGEDGEIFRNRKSYFSVNVQVVCNSDLQIINIISRWPGSAHDTTIFRQSRLRTRFEAGEFNTGILLGDSGYPLKSYLLTPLANPNTRAQQLYNESHIRTRNTVERTIGVWKRRFPCLSYGLRCKLETGLVVVVATAILYNIARKMHDGDPPPPVGIDMEEFEYLVQQGDIPPIRPQENVLYDFRNDIIDNYFANL